MGYHQRSGEHAALLSHLYRSENKVSKPFIKVHTISRHPESTPLSGDRCRSIAHYSATETCLRAFNCPSSSKPRCLDFTLPGGTCKLASPFSVHYDLYDFPFPSPLLKCFFYGQSSIHSNQITSGMLLTRQCLPVPLSTK